MASLAYASRIRPGTTKRIVAAIVREDELGPYATGDTPEKMAGFWNTIIGAQPDFEPDKECVCVVMLTSRLRTFAWHRVSLGTVSESSAHPREIFRPVILAAAHAFVVMHNHPSGDISPSSADEQVTRRIKEAADLLQVRFLDHIIVSSSGRPAEPGMSPYFSFREAGVIS
jgi:DNA repair protein RadC